MPRTLHLYRFIEDAWQGGLRQWCEKAASPPGSWLVVDNLGQVRWLLGKIRAAEIEGITFFTAETLREHLAGIAGLEPTPRGGATAAFAVKVAAFQEEGPASRNAMRSSSLLAEEADALARAGWHLNQLGVDDSIARQVHRTLDRSAILPGIFDRRLRQALAGQPARLCCVGWDAAHWPDLALLDLAATAAQSFQAYVPSPRLPADALQREWIEGLEQRLGLERVTCPESGFSSENEALVARLEGSHLASRAQARAPILLVGHEWPDQVRAVTNQVGAWLADDPAPGGPIGIIAPADSPTAVAVAEALEKAGVAVEAPGRLREPQPAVLILEQVARYHLAGHDVAELMELARLLWIYGGKSWSALAPEPVREALDRAFQAAQSRNARILARALPGRTDPAWGAVCEVVDALGRWDGNLTWPALEQKWEALLAALHLPADTLDSIWPRGLFANERIPGSAFMEWLGAVLLDQRRDAAPANPAAAAPVVVCTFAEAAQQTWSRLIFLDSNEHVWPAPFGENPFLSDTGRARLNHNRRETARLLTTHDLRALDQARFLDLLEHCRGPFAFAGVLLEQTESGHAQPNEWVLRTLLETAPEDCPYPPDLWAGAAQAPEAPPLVALDPEEHAHMERVHSSRTNGTMPFDRYQFNFNETKLEPGAWSATDLDEAVTTPATFALKQLFGAESTAGHTFSRTEGAAVGNRAHRWLGRILGLRDQLSRPTPASGDEAALRRELAGASRELEEWYAAEELPMPIWWETTLRKTAWATRRCLRGVREWMEGHFCAMEQRLDVTVQTPAGSLLLKGRIDLLISDRPSLSGASVRLFDFKTGRGTAPTLASLQKGQGAQFAAYYLLARDAGAARAVIGIIKPEDRAREVFGPEDEEALRARFVIYANLFRTLRFGRRGPLVDEHGVCETLPLATVPIDPAILDQKAGLFLLASANDFTSDGGAP